MISLPSWARGQDELLASLVRGQDICWATFDNKGKGARLDQLQSRTLVFPSARFTEGLLP